MPGGFITGLGRRFVELLYAAITGSPHGFGCVLEQDRRVVGYVAFTTDLGRLYRTVLRAEGPCLFLSVLGKMFRPKVLRGIIQNLLYPNRNRQADLPRAELLAIALAPEMRGKGWATRLLREGLAECRRRDISRVKVLVAADNAAAIALYRRCGFTLATETSSHGVPSHIYVADVGPTAEPGPGPS